MSRNQSRTKGTPPKAQVQPSPPEPPVSAFNFVVPTEVVDLPSKGQYYPEGHPLHGDDSIEIKHMTAKEEDILTSASLLKKGTALDKMLQSIIVDKRIKIEDLLIGDKNALLVASRIYGYGADYMTTVQCQTCNETFENIYDLNELTFKEIEETGEVTKTENNTFIIVLPKSQFTVEFRLMTSRDESAISKVLTGGTLELLKTITVSINGQVDHFYISQALQTLPILDVSLYKRAYARIMPDIDMTQDVECTHCGDVAKMGVPLDAGFFWPEF
jgi:hypothetical protein